MVCQMKKSVLILIATAAILAGLSGSAAAQKCDSTCGAFFSKPGPMLLFEVKELSLAAYEGGIGVGWVFSPRILGRFSVGFSSHSTKNAGDSYPIETEVMNSYTINVGIAPAYILLHEKPGLLFCGPLLRYYRMDKKTTHERRDSATASLTWAENHEWSLTAGAFLGVGITVTESILLTCEYRAEIAFLNSTRSTDLGSVSMYTYERETDDWKTDNAVVFTLSYKF
jgi:hypothetical protein